MELKPGPKKDIFYYLNKLYTKDPPYPEDNEIASLMWLINHFLSMDSDLLESVAYASRYLFIAGPLYYRLMYRLIPKSGIYRNKNIKPIKEFDDDLVKRYSDYLKLSYRDTVSSLRILVKFNGMTPVRNFIGLEEEKEKK